ncbi:GNAT family N-acetyltransferase [Actinomadura rupiterrae]|uniref:GNAT family N-acetyltransferase n=1 Tax=Actinomadura rupiterrae TaxID=559627 RepID=UPI0020A5BF4E|nr:GNAT family N-acetyltransferase [Actinomadura rupiterrae]MCP2337786.1 GNAT superfamily N-acetyltransferase [Actinomadura rupiterrae]
MKLLSDEYLADVRIRPFGYGDEARLRRMSAALSRVSLYTRFFSGTPRVPEPYVATLGRLDHWDRDALVALDDDVMIGLAEYARVPCHPERAEIAVLIADAWQRRGLGRLLTRMLLPLAARRGVTEFHADVYAGNAGALALIQHTWPSARSARSGETATFHLPAPTANAPSDGPALAGSR